MADASSFAGAHELEGRVALVTGASRNIGRAIAVALAEGGASLVLTARRDRSSLDETIAEVEAKGGRAVALLGDLADPSEVKAIVGGGLAAFGRLDIIVNNASTRNEAPIEELSFEAWREVMTLTLDAPFLLLKAALEALSASDRATIVNIGGMTAYTGATQRAHVVTAKAGLDGFTKALAQDLAPRGITVNLVSPGMIDTVRAHGSPHHYGKTKNLVGRRGAPEEVAAMVRFLCGPDARYLTGQTVHVNGGGYLP